MTLTEADFDKKPIPPRKTGFEALIPGKPDLDIVKVGTFVPTDSIELSRSGVAKNCPRYANLVFEALNNYTHDSDGHPIKQSFQSRCDQLSDDGECLETTDENCWGSMGGKEGEVFSDDMENIVKGSFHIEPTL